jgi:hypothetical protein
MSGAYHSANATVAAKRAVAVVADTTIPATRALYVGTSGDLTVTMAEDDVAVSFTNVPAGIFPIQVVSVSSTSTATNLVALY